MEQHEPALKRLIDQVQAARGRKTPLAIRGGATKAFYGEPLRGEALDLRDLAGISSHEPSELVVTARAGTPLAELEAALAAHGQCLPFEPPRFAPGGTVGGMVAAGLAGPSRASVGSVRDYVLGVTMVNGRGEVLSFGGQVMKNVAGYDVSRLMAGSLGVLGVLCEVSLKVLPVAPASATLVFEADEAAALSMWRGWASQPLPLDAGSWHQGELRLRLAGAHAAVRAACARLGGRALAAGDAAAWWTGVRDHRHPFFTIGADELSRGTQLWRVSVPATAAPLALDGERWLEWGGALRWYRSREAATVVREAAARAGGHATLFRAADPAPGIFAPPGDALMRIHRELKRAFDPDGIFNPGRLYPGL